MKVGSIFPSRKKISKHGLEKKEEEAPRKFKNEKSAGEVMLTILWDCHSLVYTKFLCDARKEKQNVTQDTYFDTIMYSSNVITVYEMRITRAKNCLDL